MAQKQDLNVFCCLLKGYIIATSTFTRGWLHTKGGRHVPVVLSDHSIGDLLRTIGTAVWDIPGLPLQLDEVKMGLGWGFKQLKCVNSLTSN